MNATTKAGITAVTVVTAAIGGVAMAAAAASASAIGISQLGSSPTSTSAGVEGVTDLDLDTTAVDLHIEFYDGDVAQLESDGDLSGWTLRRDEEELVVRSPDRGWNWFLPDWLNDGQTVTLRLPDSLEGLDAELALQAGSLRADGDFGALDATVNAGAMTLEGSARELDAEINAGRADIALADVDTAEFSVSAGKLAADLSSVPREVTIDVSAGELTLTVPDDTYDVRREVSAGSLKSSLQESTSSSNSIDASVSAGSVTLRPAR